MNGVYGSMEWLLHIACHCFYRAAGVSLGWANEQDSKHLITQLPCPLISKTGSKSPWNCIILGSVL